MRTLEAGVLVVILQAFNQGWDHITPKPAQTETSYLFRTSSNRLPHVSFNFCRLQTIFDCFACFCFSNQRSDWWKMRRLIEPSDRLDKLVPLCDSWKPTFTLSLWFGPNYKMDSTPILQIPFAHSRLRRQITVRFHCSRNCYETMSMPWLGFTSATWPYICIPIYACVRWSRHEQCATFDELVWKFCWAT